MYLGFGLEMGLHGLWLGLAIGCSTQVAPLSGSLEKEHLVCPKKMVIAESLALEEEHSVCPPKMVIAESRGNPCEEVSDCLVVDNCDVVLGPNGNGTPVTEIATR